MLTKIEPQEIMTTREAMKKYNDKYFHMVITEKVDGLDSDLGYVIYTYDSKREMRGIPRDEYKGQVVGLFTGGSVEPLSAGGLEVVHYDN